MHFHLFLLCLPNKFFYGFKLRIIKCTNCNISKIQIKIKVGSLPVNLTGDLQIAEISTYSVSAFVNYID